MILIIDLEHTLFHLKITHITIDMPTSRATTDAVTGMANMGMLIVSIGEAVRTVNVSFKRDNTRALSFPRDSVSFK
jgi:hypothetical protein